MTNQFNIIPTNPIDRQDAVNQACESSGLPLTVTRKVAVVDVTQSYDDEDRYVFNVVGTSERERFVPCDRDDVDSNGDRISSYNQGMNESFHDFKSCENYIADHNQDSIPGRVMFWSEEDELLDSLVDVDGFLGFVEIEVPYMIFGTDADYAELIASHARAQAIEDGLIEA